MAINTNGLPLITGPRTLTSGGPPIALNNEIRGGIHRISGQTGDTLADIDTRHLQAGMLVYDENTSLHYMYRNVGDAPASPPDANDPYRGADGRVPNNVGTIGAADSNWMEFELNVDTLSQIGDVYLTTPSDNQVLEYRMDADGNGNPGWINSTDNVTESLSGLNDTDINQPLVAGRRLKITSEDDAQGDPVIRWRDVNDSLEELENVVINAPVAGEVLEYSTDIHGDGTNIAGWVNSTDNPLGNNFASLSDVTLTNVNAGDRVRAVVDNTDPANPVITWENINGNVEGLENIYVNATTVGNGQTLVYNTNAGGTGVPGWRNEDISILNIAGVDLENVQEGQVLQFAAVSGVDSWRK